jgi:hypothetical protein
MTLCRWTSGSRRFEGKKRLNLQVSPWSLLNCKPCRVWSCSESDRPQIILTDHPSLTETTGRQFISSLFYVRSSEHFPQSGGSRRRAYVTSISDVNMAATYSKVTASSAVELNTNRRPQLTITSVCTEAERRQTRMDPERPHSSVPYLRSFPGYITTEKQNSPPDSLMSQGWQELPEGLPSTFNIVLYKAHPS